MWTGMLAVVLTVFAAFQPAEAWRHGGRAFGPAIGGPSWEAVHWFSLPSPTARFGYRYSLPPGAPLSYDEPGSGTTYCLSQSTGFYFACAYAAPAAFGIAPLPPIPPDVAAPPNSATAPPASGVLLFRLPQDALAAVDGVPIGLSEGVGIHAVPPGTHRVVLHVSGKETAHTVTVPSRKIFTVTPTGIVATEP